LGSSDGTKLVTTGYDKIADSYLQQFGHSAVRARQLNELADLLPSRAHVLDLDRGAGVPVARDLIARGFEVTGVDASARQIERARCNVSQAQFIRADMTTIEFPAFAFDIGLCPTMMVWNPSICELKSALLNHPLNNPVTSQASNPFGQKFEVSCSPVAPDGRNPCIISVWIIEPPDPNPRFITAYPNP
jgi:SAM-dependent methyltransferase